jgi:3-dehydroquinate synthetase
MPKKEYLDTDAVINAMKKDKKRTGESLALIMMHSSFDFSRVNDLTPQEVSMALSESKKILSL